MNAEAQVALITGASQGIGREISKVMSEAGWTVVLAARNEEKLHETASMTADGGARAHVRRLDQSDEAAIDRLAKDLKSEGLLPHALINNGAITGPSAALWDVEPADWDEAFNINLRGVYLMCRKFVPFMIERGRGAVVNIGSVAGRGPLLHRSTYTSTKAGLMGLTRTLALDAGKYGVRANLISPGGIAGERLDWVMAARARALGRDVEEIRAASGKATPLERLATPTEVANAVLFLASDASSGITGIDLCVSAGSSMD